MAQKITQNAPWKAILSLFFCQDTESAKIKSVSSVLYRGKESNKNGGSSGDKTHLSADSKQHIYALFIPLQVQILPCMDYNAHFKVPSAALA